MTFPSARRVVDTQERELGVGRRVNHRLAKVRALRSDFVVLPAKGNDLVLFADADLVCERVGVQARRVDEVRHFEAAVARREVVAVRSMVDFRDLVTGVQQHARLLNFLRELVDVLLGVDGRSLGRVESRLSFCVRLVLLNLCLRAEELVLDAVGFSLLGELVETRFLAAVFRHHEHAQFLAGNIVLGTVLLHSGCSFCREPRLLRVRRVVEPGVEDTRVPPALVGREVVLFFQDGDVEVGLLREVFRDRQPDAAAADDGDAVTHHE